MKNNDAAFRLSGIRCLTAVLAVCLISLFGAEAACARDIRVRLSDAKKYGVSSAGGITLTDAGGKSHSLGKSPALSVSGGSAVSGRKKFPLPATLKSKNPIAFNGYKYRGALVIAKSGELINVLDLEDYLRGVLKAEASPNWPMEYLKVQAIVSRTFAVRESAGARSKAYDVTNTTSSQVYHGMGAETPRTDQAVRETENRVLAYGSELAFTPFHSDSGGATANNADVWGQDLPYLRSVKEPMAYKSPNSSWELRISPKELSSAVKKVSPNVGTIKEIKVVNTDRNGRVVDLRIIGSASSATLRASAFRTAVGPNRLKSTFLTLPGAKAEPNGKKQSPPKKNNREPKPEPARAENIRTNPGGALTPDEDAVLAQLFTEGAFTRDEMVIILMEPEKRKEYLYKILEKLGRSGDGKTAREPSQDGASLPDARDDGTVTLKSGNSIPFQNGHFVFRGRGWGHGVGMSQYGAMTLANGGWNAEKILTHYFPGTKVKTVTSRGGAPGPV